MNEEIKREEIKPSNVIENLDKTKETKELRGTVGLTMDKQLIEEIKRRSAKARLSMSRYVELTLRTALRLKS